MKTLVQNGTIVTSSDTFRGDLLIEDGKIGGIASRISQQSDQVIDAAGCYVIPGGIDVHTHFQLPVKGTVSADDFTSGSMAAACGGVTTFIDFAHMTAGQSPFQAIDERIAEAVGNTFIDFGLHLGVSGFTEALLKDVPGIIGRGIPSFKLYMIYAKEGWMSDDAAMYAMLQGVKEHGGIIAVHAENPFLIDFFVDRMKRAGQVSIPNHPLSRPNFVEAEAVRRALYLTEITDSRIYVVHMSTAESASLVAEAKGKGVMAFAETCPQYLLLDDSLYEGEEGYLFPTCPPLRKKKDQEALWKAIGMGIIQVISTDHCAFTRQQKEPGRNDFTRLPGGLPGIETLLPLIYSEGVRKGRIGLNQWIDCLCTNPAKMFGLYPRKGTLNPGADADVVIFDPELTMEAKAENFHYNVDYTPYRGMTIQGWPRVTISRGRVIYREGKFTGEKSWGRFIPRYYGEAGK
jgi:dihydropyrimidinase